MGSLFGRRRERRFEAGAECADAGERAFERGRAGFGGRRARSDAGVVEQRERRAPARCLGRVGARDARAVARHVEAAHRRASGRVAHGQPGAIERVEFEAAAGEIGELCLGTQAETEAERVAIEYAWRRGLPIVAGGAPCEPRHMPVAEHALERDARFDRDAMRA
ncbi:hypothetical protein IST4112_05508 [Burkholderia cenocepacia]|nr:hypothetical protein IST4112_05508 [Burkholderia cenocepacia]